jgi:hypothetical protein
MEKRMVPNSVPTVDARLAKLERGNRRLKWLLGILIAVSLFARMPILSGNIVEAKRFVVKDDAGRTRAEFGMMDKNRIGIGLIGTDRKARLLIHLDVNQNPSICLTDANETPRFAIALDGEATFLSLLDGKEKIRVGMSVRPSGRGLIRILDAQGNATWEAE